MQDIKKEKAADSVDSVLQYLVRHYGAPSTVEALAKTRHDEIGKLYRPFLEGNTALCHTAIKGHRSTMNLVTSMISYYQENNPKDEALSHVHQGGLTPGYEKVLINILPAEDVSSTCLLMRNQTPQQQYNILRDKIQCLSHRSNIIHNYS